MGSQAGEINGRGGGLIRIEADTFTNNGLVNASGYLRGAGGGIFINASSIYGSGYYAARGYAPTANGGSGGGGRIAVWADNLGSLSKDQFDVQGGVGYEAAGNGTLVWIDKDDNAMYLVNHFRFTNAHLTFPHRKGTEKSLLLSTGFFIAVIHN